MNGEPGALRGILRGDPVRLSALRYSTPPLLIYLAHALLFGDWIVDDAGISFAYARNLAMGHGLVAQPGLAPVEGFSNFLWTVLLAALHRVRLFDPLLTPKLLSLALVGASFLLLHRSLARLDPAAKVVSLVALCLTALDTAFVAWTVSGLENPLYVFLVCVLFALLVRERTAGATPRLSLAAGAAAAGIAMTRPDGILYVLLYPLLTPFAEGPPRPAVAARRIGLFTVAFAALFGGFLIFRVAYFGDLYPNTYHVKGGPTGEAVIELLALHPDMVRKLLALMAGVAGPLGGLVAAALGIASAFLAGRGQLRWSHAAPIAFAGCAAAVYLLLPPDWMGHHRFATPFFPFFYAAGGMVAVAIGRELLPLAPRRSVVGRLAATAALGLALLYFAPRSVLLAAEPAIPFAAVEAEFGQRFNRFAAALGIENGSILLPDVGGALWSSRLRVYDLAGLCDPTIARALREGREALHEHVFTVVRPTFIHVHDYWTAVAALEADPRLARDYVPLLIYVEPQVLTWTKGRPLHSGTFVRREATTGKDEVLQAIRAELTDVSKRKQSTGQALSRPPL